MIAKREALALRATSVNQRVTRRHIVAALVLVSGLVCSREALAATFQIFTSRAAFEAAAGSTLGSQDFSAGFPSTGPGLIATSGSVSNGVFVDQGLPLVFAPSPTANLFRFSPFTTAIGADWDLSPGGAGEGLSLTAIFPDGSTEQVGFILNPLPSPFVGFWGFISDTPVAALRYQSASLTGQSEIFAIDNARFAAAAQKALAIAFDNTADATVVDATYVAPLGVTLQNPLGGSTYARALASAPSPANVVSLFASGFPAFDARSGAVDAVLSADVSTVSIDTFAVAPLEGLGSQTKKPFLEAYDASNNLVGQVYYSGPQPTIPGGFSPTETLTITVPGNTIHKARFSSQFSVGAVPTYGVFDNLSFAPSASPSLVEHFDAESPAGGPYTAFANWKVTRGSVDLIAQGQFGLSCFGNSGKCLDMDGGTTMAGRLETRVAYDLAPGPYSLSFALSGNQRGGAADSITVSLGNTAQSLYSETFNLASSAPWQVITRSINVPARTSAKLVFDHAGGFSTSDNVGILLDEVKLSSAATSASAAAPATSPGFLGALLGFFAVFGAYSLRRRPRVVG